jgi:uncharacterized membrane protein YcaP (DUF421 family)
MHSFLVTVFGEGTDLSVEQMTARGVVVFTLTLAMLRVSGRRSFGQHSPFDACITVLLGSILARAVAGASPFVPTVAAGAAMVVLHRILAVVSVRSSRIERFLSGAPRVLASDGVLDPAALRKGLVSHADVMQALRERAQISDLSDSRKVILERNGIISVLKTPES